MNKAEARIYVEPISTAFNCRLVLEETVNIIYDKEFLEMPFNKDLYNLLEGKEFASIVPFAYRSSLRIVRKTGNNAAHYGKNVNTKDALISVKYLFSFLKWFTQSYNVGIPNLPTHFDESLVPKLGSEKRNIKELKEENTKAEEELSSNR
jgi:type I restriction enzyme R subunit